MPPLAERPGDSCAAETSLRCTAWVNLLVGYSLYLKLLRMQVVMIAPRWLICKNLMACAASPG